RAERADLLCAGHDRQTRYRRELFVSNRHDAAAGAGAVLDPRNDLLADIATFVEVAAVELVHVGFVRERGAIDKVEAPTRHAEPDAMSFIVVGIGETGA